MTPPCAAPALAVERVSSHVLGLLDPHAHPALTFQDGLPGFPDCRRFLLVATRRPDLFWLQSADLPELALLLIDPSRHLPEYRPSLTLGTVARLRGHSIDDLRVLVVVTLPPAPGAPATLNLQGPIIFDCRRGVAEQVVLADERYSLRAPFPMSALMGQPTQVES